MEIEYSLVKLNKTIVYLFTQKKRKGSMRMQKEEENFKE